MSESQSVRSRRFLAVALFVLAAAGLLSSIVLPLAGWIRDERAARALALRQAARLQGLVEARPRLKATLDAIGAHPFWRRVYRGSGASAAEAAMQNDFRSLAAAQGITLDMLRPLASDSQGGFTRVALEVSFSTTIDHLGQLLLAMEAAPHFLRFRNLYVTAPMSQNGDGNALLMVRGDLVAYQLAEAHR